MNKEQLAAKFGDHIDLGLCLAGNNLNLVVFRGYAPLDLLAIVSAADEYDQVKNQGGTQRELSKKHAKETLEYALDAPNLAPDKQPRLFPEVLLNARDMSVIEVYNPSDSEELVDVDSLGGTSGDSVLGLRVALRSVPSNFQKLNSTLRSVVSMETTGCTLRIRQPMPSRQRKNQRKSVNSRKFPLRCS